ncbi:MAG TPA: DUF4260 domain-containing protein [Cytophagales bacterium]|nr:DUF4260 domain-containing protein [Cytophagales bacterium]
MKTILKTEELLMFILCIYFFSLMDYSWWLFPALILVPDVGLLGYAHNAKTGAIVYNIFHHKGIAILVGAFGILLNNQEVILTGIILFAHSSMDRMLGFGLKYKSSFDDTHLGSIGKEKNQKKSIEVAI